MNTQGLICKSCGNSGTDIMGKPCGCKLSHEWSVEVEALRAEIRQANKSIEEGKRQSRRAVLDMRGRASAICEKAGEGYLADLIDALGVEK